MGAPLVHEPCAGGRPKGAADVQWPFPCSWKCLGESLLAMYNHLTTCEPPRPSLGKRIDLSDYQDPSRPPASSVVMTPVSMMQPSPISANPAVSVAEPVLSYASVATASFPLHSSGLLETGAPVGKQAVFTTPMKVGAPAPQRRLQSAQRAMPHSGVLQL